MVDKAVVCLNWTVTRFTFACPEPLIAIETGRRFRGVSFIPNPLPLTKRRSVSRSGHLSWLCRNRTTRPSLDALKPSLDTRSSRRFVLFDHLLSESPGSTGIVVRTFRRFYTGLDTLNETLHGSWGSGFPARPLAWALICIMTHRPP